MLTILQGDALDKLQELPAESVQCCVTSPPYWGLRDYGTATWEGGNGECDHKRFNAYPTGLVGTDDAQRDGKFFKSQCLKCGAKRIDAQIGLEETPEQYVANMVEVFRGVWRVLCKDGTLWLNLGDSYAMSTKGSSGKGEKQITNAGTLLADRKWRIPDRLKPKDLVGIPWRVAFALQADGWYLRSDIIWAKPNPMPESVTDRPTKAHEYLFLLSKNERYFYDAEAIREPQSEGTFERFGNGKAPRQINPKARIADQRSVLSNAKYKQCAPDAILPDGCRNKRSVWTVPTTPYAEAHFATFPPDLIKPCILAGTKSGDVVLDPFAGSGTTGTVAIEFGRKAILIELNPDYIPLIEQRCTVTPGLPF
jgi:DNA modification methylase